MVTVPIKRRALPEIVERAADILESAMRDINADKGDVSAESWGSLLAVLAILRGVTTSATAVSYTWEFCPSCGGAGWVGARVDHRHPGCGHRCTLCYPPPGYDRTYAVEAPDGT